MSDSLPTDARVFAVASGKGGVGKTTTAVNVGAALAESGAETVVVDADLGMANVADLLGLSTAGSTLQDVLADDLPVGEATYRTHEGMAVVPGSTDLDSYAGIDPARLQTVVETLHEEFEYVILDTGAGLSHDTTLPLGLVDTVVLVTTPQESAARDTGKTRELTERLEATVGGVVVTRVREEPAELGPDRVAELVGASVLTAIPEADSVREALSAGRPIITHAPESRVTTAYRRLAAALTGREMGESVADSTESVEPADPTDATDATDATESVDRDESSDDDPTSIEELLEREADRSADLSALTGDSTPESDTDDVTDESTTDDPLALDLDGDSTSPDAEGDSERASGDNDDDGEAIAGTDGDILIAKEAPLDDDSQDDGDDADDVASEPATDTEDDPMADIPRFDEEGEEFTRGGQASDPLADDPLADDPLADDPLANDPLEADPLEADLLGDDPADNLAGDEDEIIGGHDADESFDEADANDREDVEDADDSDDTDDVAETAGPRIEMDETDDDHDKSGLFGRLTGLFR